MREETRNAVQACLDALNTTHTAEEHDRASIPPYPFPHAVVAHRAVVLAEIERLRHDGRTDRTSMSGLTTWAEPWTSLADRLPNAHLRHFFDQALPLLFIAGDMPPAEFETALGRAPSDFIRNNLRGHLVHALLTREDDVAGAERVSDTLEPISGQDTRFIGHRLIADWHARQGDTTGFFARWPRLAAGRERHHMGELKVILVESAAREHGWQAALAATDDKRLGPAYRRRAFSPLAEDGEVEQLTTLFSSPEGTGLLNELDELTVLTYALHAKAQRTGTAAHEPFTRILHRIIAIEPSPKQTMRLRDGMMWHLWPAYPDADTLTLARKAVRTPHIKRELKTLHPDIARPDEDTGSTSVRGR
ncbi:hypothetical protein [Amycolatopsis sp. NPDC004079]|uniref:hypothetical protein n=1 Tax=Amycolatopsis sp. NPDC004079 TaxID=3154549 RepID=UPI0033B25F79